MIKFGRLSEIVERGLGLMIDSALFFVFSDSENKEYILFLNRDKQIFEKGQGLDGDLGTYSEDKPIYSQLQLYSWNGKSKAKIADDPYFLVDSGELFRSFEVDVDNEGIIIDAHIMKGSKNFNLEEKFGRFVGLTDESKNELVQKIKPQIIDWIIKELLEG